MSTTSTSTGTRRSRSCTERRASRAARSASAWATGCSRAGSPMATCSGSWRARAAAAQTAAPRSQAPEQAARRPSSRCASCPRNAWSSTSPRTIPSCSPRSAGRWATPTRRSFTARAPTRCSASTPSRFERLLSGAHAVELTVAERVLDPARRVSASGHHHPHGEGHHHGEGGHGHDHGSEAGAAALSHGRCHDHDHGPSSHGCCHGHDHHGE